MTTRKYIILWNAIGALLLVVGNVIGGAVPFLRYGGIGVAATTCLAVGVHVVSRVRSGAMTKGSGISVLIYGSAISVIVPPIILAGSLILLFAGGAAGMATWLVIFQTIYGLGIGMLSFVTFSIFILCIHPR